MTKEERGEYKKKYRSCNVAWNKAHPERVSKARRKFNWKAYGILNADGTPFTLDDYDKHFQLQNGRCKMCGRHQEELVKTLSADHDHKTNLFRGLLCGSCNIGLGYYEKMKSMAVAYLQKFA